MSSIVGSGTRRNLPSPSVLSGLRHRIPADALLLTTVMFWSFHFTAAKYALTHGFAPLAYSSFRFGVAALFFTAFTYVRESSLRVERRDVGLLPGAAALGIWLNQVSFVYSVKLTTADRKSTRLNSSHANISYAVFCLKKKNNHNYIPNVYYTVFQ